VEAGGNDAAVDSRLRAAQRGVCPNRAELETAPRGLFLFRSTLSGEVAAEVLRMALPPQHTRRFRISQFAGVGRVGSQGRWDPCQERVPPHRSARAALARGLARGGADLLSTGAGLGSRRSSAATVTRFVRCSDPLSQSVPPRRVLQIERAALLVSAARASSTTTGVAQPLTGELERRAAARVDRGSRHALVVAQPRASQSFGRPSWLPFGRCARRRGDSRKEIGTRITRKRRYTVLKQTTRITWHTPLRLRTYTQSLPIAPPYI
jgi:hypothetical protein